MTKIRSSNRPDAPPYDEADHQRGAALVEFALVLPLLLAFLLGIVTVGVSYNRSISLSNSARESARYGAVLDVDGDISRWLNDVADVAVSAASGDMNASVDGQFICIAFVHPDGTDPGDMTARLTEVAGARTETAGQTCFADGRPNGERRVQVELRRRSDLEAVIYSQTLNLRTQSVARFERAGS